MSFNDEDEPLYFASMLDAQRELDIFIQPNERDGQTHERLAYVEEKWQRAKITVGNNRAISELHFAA